MSQHLSLITAESVGIGHPDKICDQISDRILNECLKHDKNSHVACEVFASNHLIVIGGEITTQSYVDVVKAAWDVLIPLGYTENDFTILSNINKQSSDINSMVGQESDKIGAGDQGIVYGYATNETKEFLPLPYVLATKIVSNLNKLTRQNKIKGIKYDTKSQISVFYDEDMIPVGIDNIVVAVQHEPNADMKKIRKQIIDQILIPLANEYNMNTDFETHINEYGEFVIGGPFGDTGLTGRKLMVDTYGSIAHHGGGAFSGKDYTKVDRTGAYFARYIAKNLVAAKVADRIEIQLSYCIGNPKPLSMYIDCFNTNKYPLEKIYQVVGELFDTDIASVVKMFNLDTFDYTSTSVYGHFTEENGKNPWEKTDKQQEIIQKLKK